MKLTPAVCVITVVSVVSVAVKVTLPLVIELTVKLTTPEEFDAPDAAPTVTPAEGLAASVAVLPAMGLPYGSFSVSVITSPVPFAVTEAEAALTVETPVETEAVEIFVRLLQAEVSPALEAFK